MWNLISKLNGKDVAMLITSVGGIILAGILAWMLFKTTTNHLEHSTTAILQQAITNEKVSASIDKLTVVLDKKIR